ncbi:MAG TPA: alternative ribosome rescue aminoacyl-tRNA hydrolase ArfB [Nitriliruptorales bacterium]|nr:alternative ribosome rescue aminoacyl-tRNA hydrolase ArfB [Nitriliruptorales bacterium]
MRIPEDEIALLFSRSGGPGGQKVNTAATKVQVRFDVDGSAVLSDEQKRRVHDRLAGRLTADGVLVLHASEHRTQARNRAAAVARLRHLLHDALAPPAAPRRPTRRPPAADRRRLEAKRQRSDKKRLREAPRPPLD